MRTENGWDIPSARCVNLLSFVYVNWTISQVPNLKDPTGKRPNKHLTLDGITYHITETGDIPCGFAEVDVKLDDNGKIFNTILTAGLVGARACDSGDKTLSTDGRRDTARPVVGWWIFAKKDANEKEAF